MQKPNMISGLLRETSFIVVMWNPESNCTCRKKNHFLFRWSTSTSPEPLTPHLIYCCKNKLMTTGTWMEKENYLMHGQASPGSFYWNKRPPHGFSWSRGDWRGNKQPQDPTMYGQICGSIRLMQRKAKQNKSGSSRNQSSVMPDNYVVSSSLTQMMKNSHTLSKTLIESWKFRCQQQCLVKHQ